MNSTWNTIMCIYRRIFLWNTLLILTLMLSTLFGCKINRVVTEIPEAAYTPPLEATILPLPSNTASPLPITPTLTAKSTVFPTESVNSIESINQYKNLRFFFRSIDRNSIFFYDPARNDYWQIETKYGHPIDVLDVSPNGCASTILLESKDVIFWEQNPENEQVLFTSELFMESLNPDEHIWQVSISPDHSSIGILVGSGYLGFDQYEFQNLFVVPQDDQRIKYQVTRFGGAISPSWNPSSNLLAYTDYNADGFHNIFSSEPDGTNHRTLLTLSSLNERIARLIWSPSGNHLALLIEHEDQNNIQLAVLNVGGENLLHIFPDITGVADLWWVSDTELAVDTTALNDEISTTKVRQIAEININTDETNYILNELETPEGMYELPNDFQILDQDLGFSSYLGFYTFNSLKFEFVKVFDKFMDISEWRACLEVE